MLLERNPELAEQVFKRQSDVEEYSQFLDELAKINDPQISQQIIGRLSANMAFTDSTQSTPLLAAVKSNLEDFALSMLNDSRITAEVVNCHDAEGFAPLAVAAYNGNLTLVKKLLEKGAELNQPSLSETTTLIAAAKQGRLEVVRFLLQQPGIDLDHKDKGPLGWKWLSGKTAEEYARANGHTAVADLLAEQRQQQLSEIPMIPVTTFRVER